MVTPSDGPLLNLDETLKALRQTRFDIKSPQKLKALIDEARPTEGQDPHPFVSEWGANGRQYRIDFGRLVSHLDERERLAEEAEQRRRAEVAQIQMPLIGGEARGEHVIPADVRLDFARAESAMNKVRRERGELVEADRVEAADLLRMKFVATFLQGLPDYLGKRLPDLSPQAIAEVVVVVDEFQERLARFLMDGNILSAEAGERIASALRDIDLLSPSDYDAIALRWKALMGSSDAVHNREDVSMGAAPPVSPA